MNEFTFLYTSDLHGSDLCFRKAIDAAVHYEVGALLIGGDLAGKSLTSIIRKPDGSFHGIVAGKRQKARSGQELERMREAISNSGSYPIIQSQEEYESVANDKEWSERQILTEIEKRLMRWLWIAELKLRAHNIRLIVICGNDDAWVLDRIINRSSFAENPEYREVILGDNHEVLAESAGNLPSPFDCPRDMEEEKLAQRIEEKIKRIKNIGQAIFMLHIPPYDTTIDLAWQMDHQRKIKVEGAGALQAHVGSTAVRSVIDRQQPLLGLHGHIHESHGVVQLGRTLCFNPGSDHHQGIMRGFLITIDRDSVKSYQARTL